jgi:hypothetical protein
MSACTGPGEAGVHDTVVPRVDERFLGQRHADPHYDAAAKLATRRFRVDHPADVVHPDPTRHAHLARNWVGAWGVRKEIRAGFGEALPDLMRTLGAAPATPGCVGRIFTPSCLRWQSL